MNAMEYKEYLESAPRYYTFQEKEFLISILETKDPIILASKLELKPKNNLEAIAMIFQARKKSVSEIIELQVKCPSCSSIDFHNVDIDTLFFKDIDKIDESINCGLYDDIGDLEDIDDLPIDEINKYEDKIYNNNKCIFDPNIYVTCKSCGKPFISFIDYTTIVSKYPIKNIYQQYLDMVQFTNMNKLDVDNMPPFEREIFMSLIQEREDKKSQKTS
jgi:ribosomal protein S27E